MYGLALLSFLLAALPTSIVAAPAKRSTTAPSIPLDFPDPAVIQVQNTWYAFATNSKGINVQLASSPDFNNWNVLQKDALPQLPNWVNANNPEVWAPDVIQRVCSA